MASLPGGIGQKDKEDTFVEAKNRQRLPALPGAGRRRQRSKDGMQRACHPVGDEKRERWAEKDGMHRWVFLFKPEMLLLPDG